MNLLYKQAIAPFSFLHIEIMIGIFCKYIYNLYKGTEPRTL